MTKVKQVNPGITIAEARDALRRSGYLLEYRVERYLDSRGFLTEPNAAYPDPSTGKSRELDVLASKIHWTEQRHVLATELVVECVNNPQPIAFLVRDQGGPAVGNAYCCHVSGVPTGIPLSKEDDAWAPLFSFLDADEFHPYCDGPVATQFCSFQRKKQAPEEWLAFHDDHHFDSVRKLCDVIDHRVESDYRTTVEDLEVATEARSNITLAVHWPVVVVQGTLLEVRPESKNLQIRRVPRIRFQISTARADRTFHYQIDVITESFLPLLIEEIEKAMSSVLERIERHRDELVSAVQRISSEALALPEDRRWRSLDHGR